MECLLLPVKKEPLWDYPDPACPIDDISCLGHGVAHQAETPRFPSGEKQGTASSRVSFPNEVKRELGAPVLEEEQSATSYAHPVKCEQSFRCQLCPDEFPTQCDLDRHHAKSHHSPTGPRSTEVYRQDLHSEEQIAMHTRQFRKENQRYHCDICPKTYAHASSLKVHKRFHSEQLPYACHLCPARFVRNSALRLHFQASHDVTSHPECGRCGKKFTFRSNLTRHIRACTGQTPYACHLCPRKFTRSDNLLLHLRIHAGDRRHRCTQCDRCFITSSLLGAHIRSVHCPEQTYLCVFCPGKYGSPGALKAHLKTHHSQVNKK
ncbi:zinc finger Y-chromosomal protein 1-like [Amblyomma americanum]